jgi:hypothetical protein
MSAARYPIRIGRRSAPLLRLALGVTPDRAWAMVADGHVSARFGRFSFSVPLENVSGWRIEGPWHAITAVGVRRSLRDGDVTFAGSPRGAVRLDLRESMRWALFDVPAFYVGVDDLEGFAAELKALGIDGEDARD